MCILSVTCVFVSCIVAVILPLVKPHLQFEMNLKSENFGSFISVIQLKYELCV
jgi:hypothetical protein